MLLARNQGSTAKSARGILRLLIQHVIGQRQRRLMLLQPPQLAPSQQRCRWGGKQSGSEIICSPENEIRALTPSCQRYGLDPLCSLCCIL
jgi:hypothetical protein